jgi:hypothetical protein
VPYIQYDFKRSRFQLDLPCSFLQVRLQLMFQLANTCQTSSATCSCLWALVSDTHVVQLQAVNVSTLKTHVPYTQYDFKRSRFQLDLPCSFLHVQLQAVDVSTYKHLTMLQAVDVSTSRPARAGHGCLWSALPGEGLVAPGPMNETRVVYIYIFTYVCSARGVYVLLAQAQG